MIANNELAVKAAEEFQELADKVSAKPYNSFEVILRSMPTSDGSFQEEKLTFFKDTPILTVVTTSKQSAI